MLMNEFGGGTVRVVMVCLCDGPSNDDSRIVMFDSRKKRRICLLPPHGQQTWIDEIRGYVG